VGLLICVAVGALVIGWITGGSIERLAYVPLHGWPYVLVAGAAIAAGAGLASAGGTLANAAGIGAAILAATCLLVLLARNRSVEGIPLLAAGLLLNAVVIAANGAMPVSLYAETRAGVSADRLFDANDGVHEIAGSDTRLAPLGDVVPVPLPVHPGTVSVGDLLIVSGVALLIIAGMHRHPED
jgi:hypothetical protein